MPVARISVLVAEDEPLVRMDIVDALGDADFIVFEAANAAEAIVIINENPHIDALFTDIDMPGSINGLKLAALARERLPPISVIVTSGHWTITEEMMPEGGVFLPKPYNNHDVIKSVRELVSTT